MKNRLIQGIRLVCMLATMCLVYVDSAIAPIPRSLGIILFAVILSGMITANILQRKLKMQNK
jgi:Flp pilus assembly protein TadB